MATFNTAVAANDDDAHERHDEGEFDATGNAAKTQRGVGDTTRFHAGLKFDGVTITGSATINSATITVDWNGTGEDDPEFSLHLNDVDDAADFTADADIVNRARTTASTLWSATGVSDATASPDFAAAVQEVIDRGGWASGQDMMVICYAEANGGSVIRGWIASLESAKDEAQIDIDYTEAGAGAILPQMIQQGLYAGSAV